MNQFENFKSFEGNATELADKAIECSAGLNWDIDAEKTNERLVRYYVAEGIIERPKREGREAHYNFRHLLQLLTARRMLAAGMALNVIGKYNRSTTTLSLEQALSKPLPKEAEILVNALMEEELGKQSSPPASSAKRSQSPPSSALPSHLLGFPDLLAEINQLKSDWMHELDFVKRLREEFNYLQSKMAQQNDQVEDLRNFLKHSLTGAVQENNKIQDWIKTQFERIWVQQEDTQRSLQIILDNQDRFMHRNMQLIEDISDKQERLYHHLSHSFERLFNQQEELLERVKMIEKNNQIISSDASKKIIK